MIEESQASTPEKPEDHPPGLGGASTTMDATRMKGLEIAVDVSKQFLAYAVSAMGVCIALQGLKAVVFTTFAFGLILGFLALSIALGLLFQMRVAGELVEDGECDVYETLPRTLGLCQIVLFAISMVPLAIEAFQQGSISKGDVLLLSYGEQSVRVTARPGDDLRVQISPLGSVNVSR